MEGSRYVIYDYVVVLLPMRQQFLIFVRVILTAEYHFHELLGTAVSLQLINSKYELTLRECDLRHAQIL